MKFASYARSLVFACAALCSAPSHAAVSMTMLEVGSDVLLTGNGSFTTAGLSAGPFDGSGGLLFPSEYITLGVSAPVDVYNTTLTGPLSFGSGVSTSFATDTSGDYIGLIFAGGVGRFAVPRGYVSGASLSGNATFALQSFATLGVTPGSYVWNLGNGDTVTLTIGPAAPAVPEPSALALVAVCALGLIAVRPRRDTQRG